MISKTQFKEKLNTKGSKKEQAARDVLEFSDTLCRALDLSRQEIAIMAELRETLDIQELGISIRIAHRRLCNEWHDIFEASPIEHHEPGYSNQVNNVPSNWTYYPQGTATICLPDAETRQEILLYLLGETH